MQKRTPLPVVALLLSTACATPAQMPAPSAQVVPFVEMPVFARPMPGPLLQPPAPITIQPPDELLKPEPRAETPRGNGETPPAPPPVPNERPECKPIPVPHRGGDDIHNTCADVFPPNRFPKMDVLVNGKLFDALQTNANVLWEIKTDRFDTYSAFLQKQVIKDQLIELRNERKIAKACGYDFAVGVSSNAHLKAMLDQDRELKIYVTGC